MQFFKKNHKYLGSVASLIPDNYQDLFYIHAYTLLYYIDFPLNFAKCRARLYFKAYQAWVSKKPVCFIRCDWRCTVQNVIFLFWSQYIFFILGTTIIATSATINVLLVLVVVFLLLYIWREKKKAGKLALIIDHLL